jgi:hypothetical protein
MGFCEKIDRVTGYGTLQCPFGTKKHAKRAEFRGFLFYYNRASALLQPERFFLSKTEQTVDGQAETGYTW